MRFFFAASVGLTVLIHAPAVAQPATETTPAPAVSADTLAPVSMPLTPVMPESILTGTSTLRSAPSPLTNAQIVELVEARFNASTIIAAMQVNETAFDVSPPALIALKGEGVPDRVMEAMLKLEAEKRAALATPQHPTAAQTSPSETVADAELPAATIEALAAALRQLEDNDEAPEPSAAAAELSLPDVSEHPERTSAPRAWYVSDGERVLLDAATAEVAVTDTKGRGGNALTALRGIGERALAFATPVLGIASDLEINGLFRNSDPKMTAVWALPGSTARRGLGAGVEIEIDFNNIPGVNPDDYRPHVVELVPTQDNYRLVGAARARLSELDDGMPQDPVIEERVASTLAANGRGHYTLKLDTGLPAGEYAIVLRPTNRPRGRRDEDTSLGALVGAGGSDILYITWPFSIRG